MSWHFNKWHAPCRNKPHHMRAAEISPCLIRFWSGPSLTLKAKRLCVGFDRFALMHRPIRTVTCRKCHGIILFCAKWCSSRLFQVYGMCFDHMVSSLLFLLPHYGFRKILEWPIFTPLEAGAVTSLRRSSYFCSGQILWRRILRIFTGLNCCVAYTHFHCHKQATLFWRKILTLIFSPLPFILSWLFLSAKWSCYFQSLFLKNYLIYS